MAAAHPTPPAEWDDRSLDPKMLSASDEEVYGLFGLAAPAAPADAAPSTAKDEVAAPDPAPATSSV